MTKKLEWKKSKGGGYELCFDLYGAYVYQKDNRWGAEIEGPSWNSVKVYKPIRKTKEAAQEIAVGYIQDNIDMRVSHLLFLAEELKNL